MTTLQDSQVTAQIQSDGQWRPFPELNWIRAGISVRPDGAMSWGGNDTVAVAENRRRYFQNAGIDSARIVSAEQVHGTVVRKVTETDAGRGASHPEGRFAGTDGFVTNVQGLVLTTLHADCAPIYYVDAEKRAIGLAHAGWKGILAGLPGVMLGEMERHFGSALKDLVVSVGPMICTEHYEVPEERAAEFERRFGPQMVLRLDGRPYLDLWAALVYNLLESGLSPERIPARPPCTFSNPQYASYRRDGPPARSMLAWLALG